MYLAKVHVKGFRNLADFTIALQPGLNVILGENNIGKTNLLDAIRLALTTTYGGDSVRLSPEDLTKSAPTHTIEVSLWFEKLTEEEQAEFLDLLNFNPPNTTASIHFTATYNPTTERWTTHRWGGDRPNPDSGIPEDVLQSIPLTMLIALRDAASALQPGRYSKLARVLKLLAQDKDRSDVEAIIQTANEALENNTFITDVQKRIHAQNHQAIGPTLSQNSLIRTSEPDFERIAQNLRLVIDNNPQRPIGQKVGKQDLGELRTNGLGYNNLLYVATVMAELHAARTATMPLLIVEEPEAHLHPQLQTRLTDGLNRDNDGRTIQTLVTSHSPTIAAHVPLATITILHKTSSGTRATNLAKVTIDKTEKAQLRRLLDVTKATLFFARGQIIVEGITEAILLPVLARRLGKPLEDHAVSVIPLCGVEFGTIARLFGKDLLQMPTSLVTDADPKIQNRENWREATFELGTQADRIKLLEEQCEDNPVLRALKATVTFEYDIANAGDNNPHVIAEAWENAFTATPSNLNQSVIKDLMDTASRAQHIWRAICIADDGRRKARFAQELATLLEAKQPDGTYRISTEDFAIPEYLKEAIRHALG